MMNRLDIRTEHNIGQGKPMADAGHRALSEAYPGHPAKVSTHRQRWRLFAAWCKTDANITDADDINQTLVEDYGHSLAEQVEAAEISARYAKNLLSGVNVVLETLHDDRRIRVSPAALVNDRINPRTAAPSAMDRDTVRKTANALRAHDLDQEAAILELARDLGLRTREAARMDYRKVLTMDHQVINITDRTTEMRREYTDRYVLISAQARRSLTRAIRLQGHNRNLIPASQSWIQLCHRLRGARVQSILTDHGLAGYHDCRAAYACDRYLVYAKHPAPAIAGNRVATKEDDQATREAIAMELGHGRFDVMDTYIGSAQ